MQHGPVGPQVCPLLEWPVCYFYWSHKLLTMSVMTVQVSLILSSPFTNSIILLTDGNSRCCHILLNVRLLHQWEAFTTALKSVASAKKIQSRRMEKCIETAFFKAITECQRKFAFSSKPSE